jgi:hypothetical protein
MGYSEFFTFPPRIVFSTNFYFNGIVYPEKYLYGGQLNIIVIIYLSTTYISHLCEMTYVCSRQVNDNNDVQLT